jgi:hypothetical protein
MVFQPRYAHEEFRTISLDELDLQRPCRLMMRRKSIRRSEQISNWNQIKASSLAIVMAGIVRTVWQKAIRIDGPSSIISPRLDQ